MGEESDRITFDVNPGLTYKTDIGIKRILFKKLSLYGCSFSNITGTAAILFHFFTAGDERKGAFAGLSEKCEVSVPEKKQKNIENFNERGKRIIY